MRAFDPVLDLREALTEASGCKAHPPLHISRSREEAQLWHETVQLCSPARRKDHQRWLAQNDLFYLIVYLLNLKVLDTNWHFKRAWECNERPEGALDFWTRGSGKSLIGTLGLNIQTLLRDPNETICIFSHTRPNAKQFLRQIKTEFEVNEKLKELFPDILWRNPKRESPKWSEDDGIVLKRKVNPKEMSVEAYGLTDGQPTGKHFDILDYDDIIPDYPTEGMIQRITDQWELSLALKARTLRFRVKGTYYDARDTYHVMIERQFGVPRVRCMVTDPDCPISPEEIAFQRQSVSPRMWALQYLLDLSAADSEIGFKRQWLSWYTKQPETKAMNIYLLCDPAGIGEGSASYTAMWIVGAFSDQRLYLLDAVRDRLNLVERSDKFFELVEKWKPIAEFYEQYALQADIEYLKEQARSRNLKLNIKRVGGVRRSKEERINDVVVWFAQRRIVLPEKGILRRTLTGKEVNLIELFVEDEYAPYPYNSKSLDMLDALARIADPEVNIVFPKMYGAHNRPEWEEAWGIARSGGSSGGSGGWMSQ
jgi:hypothetical protein